MSDLLFGARVQHIIAATLDAMPAATKAARVAYCQRTGEHGVSVIVTEHELEFMWAGELLAVVDKDTFADDAYFKPLFMEPVTEAPDDLRDLQ